MTKKQTYYFIGGTALFIALIVVLSKTGVIGGQDIPKVAIEEAGTHDIIETVSASGKIYPVSEVKISPDVSGEIIDLMVEEGDSVRKGQVLATINATTYRSAVSRANAQLNQTKASVSNAEATMMQIKAQLDQATSTFMRNKQLFEEKVISAVEFETAETAYKSAQANYQAAIENIKGNQYGVASAQANMAEAMQSLRKTIIYAPMSGIVSMLQVKKGERVVGTMQMAGTEMLRVADMSQMKVDVEVGENEIQKVSYGDTAWVTVDAYPSKKFKGVVVKISQSNKNSAIQQASTDQVTNYVVSVALIPSSYEMLFEKDRRHFPFRPGMSSTVDIITTKQLGVIAVPINAVTTREEEDQKVNKKKSDEIKEYVFVLNNQQQVELRAVTTRIQDNEYIQIESGLRVGEKVVVAPFSAIARTLKKNMKVKVVDQEDLFETADKKE